MRQLQGAFPITANTNQHVGNPPDLAVLVDNLAGGTGWTTGQMSIAILSAQPTIARPWTVYGFGMHGRGALGTGGINRGLLGRLYGAIMFGGTYTPQNNVAFSLPNPDAIPNIIKLWDGSEDPPFPLVAGIPPEPVGGYFQGSLQLPQPQQLGPADQIALLLWLTPSLTNNVETMIRQAAWNVVYDV